MTRSLSTALLTTLLVAMPAAAEPSAGSCDAPIPFASHAPGTPHVVRAAMPPTLDAEPEATLRSALHRCVVPATDGRAVRGQSYRV